MCGASSVTQARTSARPLSLLMEVTLIRGWTLPHLKLMEKSKKVSLLERMLSPAVHSLLREAAPPPPKPRTLQRHGRTNHKEVRPGEKRGHLCHRGHFAGKS